MTGALVATSLDCLPRRQAKVRDVYTHGDKVILVCTDRLPGKSKTNKNTLRNRGKMLHAFTAFWLRLLETSHAMITDDIKEMIEKHDVPLVFSSPEFRGRTMLYERVEPVPYKCYVHGYLTGAAWKEYDRDGTVGGQMLPSGLQQSQMLLEPAFLPFQAQTNGAFVPVSVDVMAKDLGEKVAFDIAQRSVDTYKEAAKHCWDHGLILADTKFEWATPQDEPVLINEVCTPNCSRYWPTHGYRLGQNIDSFDEQFVQGWLEDSDFPPDGMLPYGVIEAVSEKYKTLYRELTGLDLEV